MDTFFATVVFLDEKLMRDVFDAENVTCRRLTR